MSECRCKQHHFGKYSKFGVNLLLYFWSFLNPEEACFYKMRQPEEFCYLLLCSAVCAKKIKLNNLLDDFTSTVCIAINNKTSKTTNVLPRDMIKGSHEPHANGINESIK